MPHKSVWRMRVEKPQVWATAVFFIVSKIQGKTMAKPFQALKITASAPGQHMWPNPGPWPNSKCSKTVEVGCSCSELKSARVSTLTGSLAQCHAKWPRGSREFHHPAGIEPEQPYSLLLTLTTKAWVLVCLQKKMNISSSVLQPVLVLQLLF